MLFEWLKDISQCSSIFIFYRNESEGLKYSVCHCKDRVQFCTASNRAEITVYVLDVIIIFLKKHEF